MKLTATIFLAALATTVSAEARDKVVFGTNWAAQAEQGGFFQALADGTYERFGLDVTILPGGPQTNNRLLLATGKIDFYMDANLISLLVAAEQKAPTVGVAAINQKAPFAFISHPGVGVDRFEDLPGKTVFLGKEALATDFHWLKRVFGFRDENVKPYAYNPQPFLADKLSIQQAYVTSEPYQIEKKAGFKPNVFLIADHGFDSYSTLIETRADLIRDKPDLVQRFVDASITGWYHYLYRESRAGDELILRANPEMEADQIRYSVEKLREFGVIDSGEALSKGVGAMSPERVQKFAAAMAEAGVIPANLDYSANIDYRFVNKKAGMSEKP